MSEQSDNVSEMESDPFLLHETLTPLWHQFSFSRQQGPLPTLADHPSGLRLWRPAARGSRNSAAGFAPPGSRAAFDASASFPAGLLPVFGALQLARNGYEEDSKPQQRHRSLSSTSSASHATAFDGTRPLVRLFRCSRTTATMSLSDEYRTTPTRQLRKCNSHLRLVRFPARKNLPQTRRRAAATIIRWWRSKGVRVEERRLFASRLIQRVGRGYLMRKRLKFRVEVARDRASSLARSVRLCASISTRLHKLAAASATRVPADGLGFSVYDGRGLSDSKKRASARFYSAAPGQVAKANASMRAFGKGVRGVHLVNFGFSNSPDASTADASAGARSVGAFDGSNFSVSTHVNENAEPKQSPLHSHREGIHALSLSHLVLPNNANRVEEARPQSEAFCCMFNSRVSLEPLSIKVVRASSSIDHAELGPWNPASAKRSTIERVRPDASLM
ncbi:uncharacterized protein Tco025E_08927 [Trypanosoma conorhini]|uniref:Uncharacterized protein n=1 Tax=Trypanosoma conorhini TaxID=83891 RepID=A0A422N316_9TRYP|nr:uncharacterized protein Tco025E_08927 [Trypanosoma conorhini]RNE99868.1 hypothetical protein Tco025E_08927 [Trypanosoma conorhini]